jgi:hypothetical protein
MVQKSTDYRSLFSFPLLSILFFFSSFMMLAQKDLTDKSSSGKHFDGLYLGMTLGVQNIFGGAFIDDLDVLGQKSGFVAEFSPGYRKQFLKDRLMLGVALQFGITDGNLEQVDTRNQMKINYKNNSQFGYGINLGTALGKKKRFLLYVFGNVTKRNFDITVTQTTGSNFTQEDGQKFGRYGLGFETPIFGNFNILATVGRVSVDYGDLETNIDIDDKTDFNIGVVYQF